MLVEKETTNKTQNSRRATEKIRTSNWKGESVLLLHLGLFLASLSVVNVGRRVKPSHPRPCHENTRLQIKTLKQGLCLCFLTLTIKILSSQISPVGDGEGLVMQFRDPEESALLILSSDLRVLSSILSLDPERALTPTRVKLRSLDKDRWTSPSPLRPLRPDMTEVTRLSKQEEWDD